MQTSVRQTVSTDDPRPGIAYRRMRAEEAERQRVTKAYLYEMRLYRRDRATTFHAALVLALACAFGLMVWLLP